MAREGIPLEFFVEWNQVFPKSFLLPELLDGTSNTLNIEDLDLAISSDQHFLLVLLNIQNWRARGFLLHSFQSGIK